MIAIRDAKNKKGCCSGSISLGNNYDYGSIDSNGTNMGLEVDMAPNHHPNLIKIDEIETENEEKQRIISSSILSSGFCLLSFIVAFWIVVSYDSSKRHTVTSNSMLMRANPNSELNMKAEANEIFQIPFPQIDRSEYGSNPVPASSIVDPKLFAPSLRGDEDESSSSLLKVPFPTGAFWTNLVIKPTADRLLSYPIMAYPYGYKWNPDMLQVSYPSLRRQMDELSIRDIFNPDLTLTTMEDVTSRHINHFDPLSVTLRFESSEHGWETYLVQGSPYVTARYEQMTPIIRPISIFKGISCLSSMVTRDDGGLCEALDGSDQNTIPPPKFISLRGTTFVITTRENLSWILFMSKPVTLVFDNIRKTTISTKSQFTGVIRLALLPPPPKENLSYTSQFPESYEGVDLASAGVRSLIKYSNLYPVGADVSWEFPSQKIGVVSFRYETKSMTESLGDELLMLALPHHADAFSSSSSVTTNLLNKNEFDLIYKTIKGHMAPVLGSTWSYDEALTSISFDYADKNAAKLDDQTRLVILDQVTFDVTRVLPTLNENVYGYGKQLSRLAQLVHIANVLVRTSNDDDLESKYSTMIKDATTTLHDFVTAFLSGRNTDVLVYDANFGGMVTTDGLNDFMGDFGNGWYNDHHFHYGYFLYSCALLGQWNSTFVKEYGMKVDTLMFDVTYSSHISSNETHTANEVFFPLARHKSWFDSHSFASGLFPFATGKSMESSSESINCYYGAYLWSSVRERKNKRKELDQLKFARLLLAMEIRGVKAYWHMTRHSSNDTGMNAGIYNPTFEKNLMVGNLGMMDVTISTWFGSNPLYVHMINFMPITGVTRELFEIEYLKKEFSSTIKPIYANVEMAWKGYVICDRAMIDPNAAWNDALELRSNELDQAISQSQVLFFISTTDGFEVPNSSNAKSDSSSQSSKTESSTSNSPYCWDQPACKELSLTGLCCPTSDGTSLGCCNSVDNADKPSTNAATSDYRNIDLDNKDGADSGSCSGNARCAALGLNGLCCPGPGGANLDCCNDKTIANVGRPKKEGVYSGENDFVASNSCLSNAECAALGLTGECCPTPNGGNLSCCD